MKESRTLFHIIWTVFGENPVGDDRGNWDNIKKLYLELKDAGIAFEHSDEFAPIYKNTGNKNVRLLSEMAQANLRKYISDLTKMNGDRIAGNMEIIELNVHPAFIEMIVFEDENLLNQKISRIKSRTATLLSFDLPEMYSGKGTWGKGIWISKILNREEEAISMLRKDHVGNI